MQSYGLKPWEDDDAQEGKQILAAFAEDDKQNGEQLGGHSCGPGGKGGPAVCSMSLVRTVEVRSLASACLLQIRFDLPLVFLHGCSDSAA